MRSGKKRSSRHDRSPSQPKPQNLMRFLGYARPYRWLMALVVVLGVVRYALQFVTPWGVGVLLDGALRADNLADRAVRIHQVYWVAGILTSALIVRCCTQFAESILTNRLGNRLVFDLRRRLYVHIHRQSQSFFDRQQVGSIGSRVLNDISVAQNLIGSGVISVVIDAIALVFTLAVLFRLEWRLTLVASLIMPVYVVALRRYNPRIRSLSQEIQDRFSEISGTVFETLAGMQVVQAFTKERSSERQFVHETRGHYERLMQRTRYNAILNCVTIFLTGFGTILLLWSGGQLVIGGLLTAGMLVQFYSYVSYLYGPLSRFAELNQVYQNSMGAVDRVFEIMDMEPDVIDRDTQTHPGPLQGRVRFENVFFGYDSERPVLQEIDLDVEPGQVVAFVGPSGSGKTTITKLLLRFYDVNGGAIRFDDRDLRDFALHDLRRNVGVVLQEPILFTGSVRDNILFGRPTATEEEMIAAAQAANAHDFVMELPEGYDTLVGERGAHLSGGQRQRISIARALLKDPKILILDEATSALDSESERLIQQALERLMEGRTSFVVAHRLSTIVQADQIVVLDRGRIVERGTHEELLLRNGLYAELCAKQFIGVEPEVEGDWTQGLRVAEVMSRDFTLLPEDLPVADVLTAMQVTHQNGFPVANSADELIGMVTLSDVEEALFDGKREATVGEICTRELVVTYPEQPLGKALEQLEARDIGNIPVVERGQPGRLRGMLRPADVVLALSRLTGNRRQDEALNRTPLGVGDSARSLALDGLRFFEVVLSPESVLAGRRIRDLDLPRECILVTIRRDQETHIPRGETEMKVGDRVIALGRAECAAALERSLASVVGHREPDTRGRRGSTVPGW